MKKDYFLVNCGSSRQPAAVTKISPQDAEKCLLFKWSFIAGSDGRDYVRGIDRRTKPPVQIKMHRLIMGAPDGSHVDHINGDPLDNRRENLRIATPQQNQANRRKRTEATSIYKGVSWHKKAKKWRAVICVDGKQIHLGFHDEQADAADAYDKKATSVFGEFVHPNNANRIKTQSKKTENCHTQKSQYSVSN